MPRRRRLSAEALRRTLREWDATLDDARLSAEERREIERLLAVSSSREEPVRAHRRRWQLAWATGGGLVVVLALLLAGRWPGGEGTPRRDTLPLAGAAAERPAASEGSRPVEQAPAPGRAVQVQLIARGGTRIVWVLNPQLPALPDNLEEQSYAK